MDTAIINAWEHRRVREDDDAYEGRINLGPPNDVAAAYEREDQCAAVAVCPSSGHQSGSFNGQHIPPAVPPQRCHTEGGEGINLQLTSQVVMRGLSAAAAATSGVAGHTRGGRPFKSLPKQRSAAAAASSTAEVTAPAAIAPTPIPVSMQKSPPSFGVGNVASVRASINTAALEANSNDDGDTDNDVDYSYFGELPNPDLEDLSPRDVGGNFISLFVGLRKCQVTYNKSRKVTIFYEALTVDKKELLGNNPPHAIQDRFKAWSQVVKQQQKWTLDGIAKSVFLIACHVHDRQEKLCAQGGHVTSNSKIIALVLMHSFFFLEINLAEAVRQSQNKAAISSLLTPKAMKPLPPNFCYDADKVCIFMYMSMM